MYILTSPTRHRELLVRIVLVVSCSKSVNTAERASSMKHTKMEIVVVAVAEQYKATDNVNDCCKFGGQLKRSLKSLIVLVLDNIRMAEGFFPK